MKYWLMKSEPEEYSIDDLAKAGRDHWDGIRNYQVRNMMRDDMRVGDLAFFYHSNSKPPGIVGVMKIVREGYPDHTAFDPDDKHFDAKSDPDNPRWFMVDVEFVEKFERAVSLPELREHGHKFEDFPLLRKGNRLSVMPVTKKHWTAIVKLAKHYK